VLKVKYKLVADVRNSCGVGHVTIQPMTAPVAYNNNMSSESMNSASSVYSPLGMFAPNLNNTPHPS